MAQPWIINPGLGRLADRAGHTGQNDLVLKAKRDHSRLIFQEKKFEKLGPATQPHPLSPFGTCQSQGTFGA